MAGNGTTVKVDKIVVDWAGVGEMLRTDPAIKDAVTKRANGIADRARSTAPRVSGDYARSIRVRTTVTRDMRMNRFAARVVATIWYADQVEARHGTLARALGR